MNFLVLTEKSGAVIRINFAHVIAYQTVVTEGQPNFTALVLAGPSKPALVTETVEIIDKMLGETHHQPVASTDDDGLNDPHAATKDALWHIDAKLGEISDAIAKVTP